VQEMVYLKVVQNTKNHRNGRFCVGDHRSKNVSEGFSPLSPPPGSAYVQWTFTGSFVTKDWWKTM